MVEWLIDLLKHFGTPRAFGHSGNQATLGTRALEVHLGTRSAFGHSGTDDTWALGYSKTRKTLGHSGCRALEALEALYLADS